MFMHGTAVIVGSPADETHARRLRALAGAVGRLGTLTGLPPDSPRSAGELIRSLAAAGLVAVEGDGPWTLWYVPSLAVLTSLDDGSLVSWDDKIDAKQRKALRRVPGALFRLPFADDGTDLQVFTTDWSPFTAACAVAVHPDHPVLSGTVIPSRPYFSGRFVRHPLHGDLLPVWVADWVKPEFGTGAVVVNPAHSAQDLEFARQIGLPVRFGLAAAEPGADPATWPAPPVIRSGQAVRAGHHDGLVYAEAAQAYLRELADAGHAEQRDLVSLGKAPLAILTAADDGALTWSPTRRTDGVGKAEDGVGVSIEPSPILTAAACCSTGAALVTTTDAVAGDLLWLRLLRADLGAATAPARILSVARIGSIKDADPQWLDQALVVAGRPNDTVSVRGQLTEQVARSAEAHTVALSAPGEPADDDGGKQATAIYQALAAADFTVAFAATSGIARSLRKDGHAGAAEREAFLAAMYVLFGLALPGDFRPDRFRREVADH